MIQRADIAMYSAKEGGGGHAMFEPRLDRFSPRRLSLERPGVERFGGRAQRAVGG